MINKNLIIITIVKINKIKNKIIKEIINSNKILAIISKININKIIKIRDKIIMVINNKINNQTKITIIKIIN